MILYGLIEGLQMDNLVKALKERKKQERTNQQKHWLL